MTRSISPWTNVSFQLASPDEKWVARYFHDYEIGMGAPTSGFIRIKPWKSTEIWESCNPSMVWSDDSKFLAIPQWTQDRRQRLLLISIEHQRGKLLEGDYRVLELHSFDGQVLRGIDSSGNEIEIVVTDLQWEDV